MYTQGQTAYQDTEVLTASQERLVSLLYEGLLKRLRQAGKQIAAGDIEGKSQSLQKASAIVYELLSSLDFEAGGELASRLAGLYGYFAQEIMEIGRDQDVDRLEALTEMIASLYEAWDEAARTVGGQE
jgi:flagellar protein FliS